MPAKRQRTGPEAGSEQRTRSTVRIVSKSRPECPTAQRLAEPRCARTATGKPAREDATCRRYPDWRIVVEPQDAKQYAARWGDERLEILPANDRGLPFVRNHVLDRARRARAKIWMLDDDIRAFHETVGGETRRTCGRCALALAEAKLAPLDVALGGLEYQQFAWTAGGREKLDGYCDVAVLLDGVAIPATMRYEDDLTLKEDRDFALQIVTNGLGTARVTAFSFTAPKNGSNRGGLAPLYATAGREETAVDRLIARWPGIVTKTKKPDGRIDAKIDWRRASGR